MCLCLSDLGGKLCFASWGMAQAAKAAPKRGRRNPRSEHVPENIVQPVESAAQHEDVDGDQESG